MAGKIHRVTIVVSSIVHDLHVGEAHKADHKQAEQSSHCELQCARLRGYRTEGCCRVHQFVLSPSTRGPEVAPCRRQVSWLAASAPRFAFPVSQWLSNPARRLQLRGQQRHWDNRPAPHSLWSSWNQRRGSHSASLASGEVQSSPTGKFCQKSRWLRGIPFLGVSSALTALDNAA